MKVQLRNLTTFLPGIGKRNVNDPEDCDINRERDLSYAIGFISGTRDGSTRFNLNSDTYEAAADFRMSAEEHERTDRDGGG